MRLSSFVRILALGLALCATHAFGQGSNAPFRGSFGSGAPVVGNVATNTIYFDTSAGYQPYIFNSGSNSWVAFGVGNGGAGGSNTQCQYNNAGVFAGISGCTSNGIAVTLASPSLSGANFTDKQFSFGGNAEYRFVTDPANTSEAIGRNAFGTYTSFSVGQSIAIGANAARFDQNGNADTAVGVGSVGGFNCGSVNCSGGTTINTSGGAGDLTGVGYQACGYLQGTPFGDTCDGTGAGDNVGGGSFITATGTECAGGEALSAIPLISGSYIDCYGGRAAFNLQSNASYSAFFGAEDCYSCTTPTLLTVEGALAAYYATNPTESVINGAQAAYGVSNTPWTGTACDITGYQAAYTIQGASASCDISGYQAAYNATVFSSLVAEGSQADYYGTTVSQSVFIGHRSGYGVSGAPMTSATGNGVSIGEQAGFSLQGSVADFTVTGAFAAQYASTPTLLSAYGYAACEGVSGTLLSGANDSCFGASAGNLLQGTASGDWFGATYSGRYATSPSNTTCTGALSCEGVSSGTPFNASNLAAYGYEAAQSDATGSGLILGPSVGSSTFTSASHLVLIGTASNCDSNTSNFGEICASSGATPVLSWNSTAGALAVAVNGATLEGAGTLDITGAYWDNATAGVTCSGTPSSSFATTGGIVTHC